MVDTRLANGYYANSRPEIRALVPDEVRTLLDVGCGEGGFGAALRADRPDLQVWGVEMNAEAASIAASRYDEVLVGPFPDVVVAGPMTFDCIAFNDVLEHMLDPWGALKRSREFVSDRGSVIVSLPNIGSFGVIGQLLRGEFNYVDSGVLDRTHLRFFTLKTAVAMAEGAGYAVRAVHHSWPHLGRWPGRVLKFVGLGRFNGRQIILVLNPK